MVGPMIITFDRYTRMDFLHPWLIEPIVLLIPPPFSSVDWLAIWRPFNSNVIVTILVYIYD